METDWYSRHAQRIANVSHVVVLLHVVINEDLFTQFLRRDTISINILPFKISPGMKINISYQRFNLFGYIANILL